MQQDDACSNTCRSIITMMTAWVMIVAVIAAAFHELQQQSAAAATHELQLQQSASTGAVHMGRPLVCNNAPLRHSLPSQMVGSLLQWDSRVLVGKKQTKTDATAPTLAAAAS